MGFAKRYRKHPDEIKAVVWPFADFLATSGDTHLSHEFKVDAGVIVETDNVLANGDIGGTVSFGTSGRAYTIACEMTTTAGLIERREIRVVVMGRGAREGIPIDGGSPADDDSLPFLDGGSP